MFIVTYGDIGEGYNFVGPFKDEDDAFKWGEANFEGSWEVIPVIKPQDEEAKEPMSQEDYAKNFGNLCPSCLSGNINTKVFKIGSDSWGPAGFSVIREKDCSNCKAEWTETYINILYGYNFKWRSDTPGHI